jgi:hypothetical protein
VHGQIGAAFLESHFQLLDEQALAAHLGQGSVQNLVALGRHPQQIDAVAAAAQDRLHMLGLPHGQLALTCGNDDGCG